MNDEHYYEYVKHSIKKFMILSVYVDNILVPRIDNEYIKIIKNGYPRSLK